MLYKGIESRAGDINLTLQTNEDISNTDNFSENDNRTLYKANHTQPNVSPIKIVKVNPDFKITAVIKSR